MQNFVGFQAYLLLSSNKKHATHLRTSKCVRIDIKNGTETPSIRHPASGEDDDTNLNPPQVAYFGELLRYRPRLALARLRPLAL